MNRFTFVLPSENQNAFRLLSICANAVYNVIQSLNRQGRLVDQIFCKDVHESLKYVDEFFELKNDEIQIEHASLFLSLSLSLSLSTCRSIESTQSVAQTWQKPMYTIKYISISVDIVRSHARIQRGGGAGGPDTPTWKITKI